MNRRKFFVSGFLFSMLSNMKAVHANYIYTAYEFGRLIIAAIVGALAARLTEKVTEGDPRCTTTTTYSFDGVNCIQCQACVAFLENGMIDAAMNECPTESIKLIEVTVSCPK